jgi:GNAT superfamily N-acetyltransferase
MNIEFAKVEHSKRLSEIVLAASEELREIDFNEEGWNRFVSSNTPIEFEIKLSKPGFSIFCYVESNCIIGFLSLKDNEKIDQLFVVPDARNRRVASSLWQHAKKNAVENGASGMFWVRSSSVAVPVYQKFGFICEGDRQSFGGINFQLMRLAENS